MHEILTLQIGQCGNQIGNEFWKRISAEHELKKGGRPDKMFLQGMIPRAIFIDSEPRVIDKQFRNNFFIANDGVGAGNNFAYGYKIGQNSNEEVLDLIRRHVEACDNIESMLFIHSTAGGTGSGFGSYLSDALREIYGSKKYFVSFAVLPTNKEASEVVVQPYNTVLALEKLYNNMDSVVLMDNYALGKQTFASNLINSSPLYSQKYSQGFDSLNDVVSDVISNFTSSIRFPSYSFCSMSSIKSALCPFPSHKFIIPSYIKQNSCISEIMNNLIRPKTMLCDYEDSSLYTHFAIFNNFSRDVHKTSNVTRTSRLILPKIKFYGLPFYLFNLNNSASSLGLANSTAPRTIFAKILNQFDKLRSRKAFMETYRKYDCSDEVFSEARDRVDEIIKNLEICEESRTSYE